jgi:hypothetical protein
MKAVACSYNWETGESYATPFEGPEAADHAAGFVHKSSFIWNDFPEEDGWTHFFHADKEAMEERGERIAEEILRNGTISERVYK